jgi:hypothetical protein
LEQHLDQIIDPFFSARELDQLAREAGFIQRKGKLKGSTFFDLVVFNSDALSSQSLNDQTITLRDRNGIEIRKQSLHERFNEHAFVFLRRALEQVLHKQLQRTRPVFETADGFERILIKDSTCFQIDESLAEAYPGSGGSGSAASVRIQFEYDVLTGRIHDLSIGAFNEQDAKNSIATIDGIASDDLVMRDLAYMSLDILEKIAQREAFYLCRPNPIVKIYEKKGDEYHEVDFIRVLKYLKERNMTHIEKEVYLGVEKKLCTRLIIHRLPDTEVGIRLRKARESNKKKGRGELTKEYKARAHLNLFITNASEEALPAENTWSLYRIRWQIELVFKVWKSVCHIAKVKKVKKERLECYILSKLILIVLGWHILWGTTIDLFRTEGKVLSLFKASKTLFARKISSLRNIFISGKGNLGSFLADFYDISRVYHLLEKKKSKPSSFELLLNCLNVDFQALPGAKNSQNRLA